MPKTNDEIGPYTLVEYLGEGAFGEVWLAEKRTPIATSQVAIKIPIGQKPDIEAIKAEAKLWSQIGGHPNVLPMIEANIYNGQVVIVSEYAPDGSLESWMGKYGGVAPSIELAVAMANGILSGLEHLHSKKVLHRDLKPANILLQAETPRLADFGLSRVLKTIPQLTKAAGSPAYMSPEALDGKKVISTDIWAVGVIFYQLLTGNFPFPIDPYSALIGAIFGKTPEALPTHLKQFQDVISKALEKDPENRYPSATEMKAAINSCLLKAPLAIIQPSVDKNGSKTPPFPNVQIGPYTLLKKLGKGAFGEVWLGEKQTVITKTRVAIKLPLDKNPDLEAIKKEAEVWAYIGNHPNILPLIEADIYGEHILIVSEFAPDGSLEDWIKNHGGKAPSIELAVEMTKGILLGLEHLHSKKVLHRDLKPANILLQGETPRLADFGLARVLKSQHSAVVAGSPAFMAPESFEGTRLEQTDIWAVTVILYQLLSGYLPFSRQNMNALIIAISQESPEVLPNTVPKKIQELILRGLEKEPTKRFASATEMRVALQEGLIAEIVQNKLPVAAVAIKPVNLEVNTINNLLIQQIPSTKPSTSNPQLSHLPQASVETKTPNAPLPLPKPSIPTRQNSKIRQWIVSVCVVLILACSILIAVKNQSRLTVFMDSSTGVFVQTRTLSRHKGIAVSLVFSADGKTLASGGGGVDEEAGEARLWDVQTGELIKTVTMNGEVIPVVISPDLKNAASADEAKTVRIWDIQTGKVTRTIAFTERVWRIAFSPDGAFLAAENGDKNIEILNVRTGLLLQTLTGHTNVNSVAFSLDGKLLASGDYDNKLRLWDVNSGRLLFTLQGHSEPIEEIAFSPNGKVLASGSYDHTYKGAKSGEIKLWDVQTGSLLRTLPKEGSVESLAFSPDGMTLATGALDGNNGLRLWDVKTGSLKQEIGFNGAFSNVVSMAFSPDGKILAIGSGNHNIYFYEVSNL